MKGHLYCSNNNKLGIPNEAENSIIKKITQPHKTRRFKWFGLISLHPLAETTQKKFTIKKMEYKK
jgi:hypothetical protein